jgi:ABC-2 type transport system permease protein
MREFLRFARQQISVQLQIRTFNLYSLLLFFIQPAIFSAVGMILSRAAGRSTPDLVYTVIGGGILGMWSGMLFTSTYDIRSDRRDGILELLIASPTSLRRIEAVRTFTNIAASLVSLLFAMGAAVLIFRFSFVGIIIPKLILAILVLLYSLWCLGVFLANFLAWSRLSGSIVDFLELPIAFLCGFMYPIRVLPQWLQGVSTIVPVRWALQALDSTLVKDQTLSNYWLYLGMAVLTASVFWMISLWLDQKVHDHIRLTGELSSI